jgi:hypothetical protein
VELEAARRGAADHVRAHALAVVPSLAAQREVAPNPSPAPLLQRCRRGKRGRGTRMRPLVPPGAVFTLITVLCQRDTGTCATDPGVPGQCTYNHVNFEDFAVPPPLHTPYGQLTVKACGSLPNCGSATDATSCLLTNFTKSVVCSRAGSSSGPPPTPPDPPPSGPPGPPPLSPHYTFELPDPDLTIGMVQGNGASCGPFVPVSLSVTIAFECVHSASGAGQLVFNGMSPSPDTRYHGLTQLCNFNVTWQTSKVCALPHAPGRGKWKTGGMAWTLKFVLVFVGVGLAYCVVGTVIKTKLMGNSSANFYNNIPNREFWFGLPSLVADGFRFTGTKLGFVASTGTKKQYETVDTGRDDSSGGDDGPKE